MSRFPANMLVQVWAIVLLPAPAAAQKGNVIPLPRAHAHNDYEHARPLVDALRHGFCSVEADIHLVRGELLVAHDPEEVRPDRTLEALYLAPLRARVRRYGGGVYPQGPPFFLLIDIKTGAEATYGVLRDTLVSYADILTRAEGETVHAGPVTVVISGNRPLDLIAAEKVRYCGIDGRLGDLESDANPSLLPWISDNWTSHFRWRGEGEIPQEQRQKLQDLVAAAHARGRMIRFWATPDTPAAWKALDDAGVDLINTDNLSGLAEFLRGR